MAAIFAIAVCILSCLTPTFAQTVDSVLVEEYSVGSFHRATRIVAGTQGILYVIDADNNTLLQFTDIQSASKTIGGFGWSPGSFDKPTGVATDGVNVYVSDYGNHRIQRFDRNLNYISSLSTRDTSDVASQFGYPLDVSVSELGDMFVIDGENLRITKFNPNNYFERSFGGINSGEGKLQNPIKIIATNSRIFVGERSRIAVFDNFGNYLGSIGKGSVSDLNGFVPMTGGFLLASSDTLWWFSHEGAFLRCTPISSLITGERIDRIQDIACIGSRLFILSPQRIHVFKMSH
jgi:hypothetical protein